MTGEHPWVCIIGGGKSQVPFIEAAAAEGARSLVFDGDPAAPAREIADRFVPISTHDTAGVLEHCEGFDDGPPVGCFTYSSYEQALVTTAAVVERFGLRGLTSEALHRTSSKPRMRAHLSNSGVAVPAWQRTVDAGELAAFRADHGTVMVKPARGGVGSAGVALIDDATADAIGLLETACSLSSDGAAILEEFLEGDEYSIDGYVVGGSVRVLATSRKHTRGDHFVIEGYVFDREEVADPSGRFGALAARTIGALALDDTFFSLDVLFTADGPVVLDAGPLLDAKMDRLLWHSGIDVYRIPTAAALGQLDSGPEEAPARPGAHGLRFLYADRPGTLGRAAPGEFVDEDGVRLVFELEREVGSAVAPPTSVADTIGWLYATGENPSAVWATLGDVEVDRYVGVET